MKKNRILAAAAAPPSPRWRRLPALADLTIGVSISLTGPTSALGIPTQKGIALWPKEIAGEKLNVDRSRRCDRPDQGRAEHEEASSPRTRSTSSSAR